MQSNKIKEQNFMISYSTNEFMAFFRAPIIIINLNPKHDHRGYTCSKHKTIPKRMRRETSFRILAFMIVVNKLFWHL